MDLTYEKLSEINPRLIYTTNTGYGRRATVSKPSFDLTVQALTGLMVRLGEPGQPPVYLGMGSGDALGGLMSALGIVLALHQRLLSGKGQHVDASLYGAQLYLAAPMLQAFLATGRDRYSEQQTRRAAPNPLWNRYAARDKWVFLCVENDDASWLQLCETLGDSRLSQDPRFATVDGRRQHAAELTQALDEVIAKDTADGWLARWKPLGITASPIQNMEEVSRDPQAWENDYFAKIYSEEARREVTVRGLPITLGKTPAALESLGPELGQHTELILADTLGLSWDRIGELKAQGVIP